MKDLSELFAEFSKLVIEQGTIMDRIDENIYSAKDNTQKAGMEIKTTYERETSRRAHNCMICLVQSILICIVIIAMQHANFS